MSDLHVVVIGAGSGGMAAAKKASREGAEVTIVENRTVGGTCVARGCMPKKFMVISSEIMRDIRTDGPDGIDRSLEGLNWSELIDHQRAVVRDLIGINRESIDDYEGIRRLEGTATISEPGVVSVDGSKIEYDRLIIATGLHPSRPPIEGVELGQTSGDFLQDRTRPDSVVIVGGGYIGVEFACVLNAFGTDVTVLHRPPHLVKNYDNEIADQLESSMSNRGIEVRTSTEVTAIHEREEEYRVQFETEDGPDYRDCERPLLAVGRSPNTDNIGLGHLDVQLDPAGYIKVDDTYRTDEGNVFAVGDVNGEYQFTPVAIKEGKTAAVNAVQGTQNTADLTAVPTAVFTDPPIGSAGLSEAEAREQFGENVEIATKSFTPFSSTVRRETGTTFIKLVYTGNNKSLKGIHILGPHAPEIVQGFSMAIRQGVTQEDFKDYPGIHPTIAEEIFSTRPS
ncbi:MAG: NAD(P)/FAD-dependent oxidoreductase [bacterium]